MIKITGIKIKDFGRHRSIQSEFDSNVIGLTGPNGSGKSTVLQAIQFALTGTIDHPDPLKAFVRRSGEEEPPKRAEVTLDFVADGKPGKIYRKITATSSARTLSGLGLDKEITSDKGVQEALFNILGVDKRAINSTVFIRQGEMASMFGKDTDRRDFYTRLLMLGHLEKIGDVVENHRKQISGTIQELGPAKDAARLTYEEAVSYFEECERELLGKSRRNAELIILRKLSSLFVDQASAERDAEKAEQVIANLRPGERVSDLQSKLEVTRIDVSRLSELRDRAREARQKHSDAQNSILRHEKASAVYDELDKAEQAVREIQEETEDPGPEIDSISAKLAGLERKSSLMLSRAEAVKSLDEAKENVDKLTPEVAELEVSYQGFRSDYSRVDSKLAMMSKIKGELSGKTFSCCPACGSDNASVDYLTTEIENLKESAAALNNEGGLAGDKFRSASAALVESSARWKESTRDLLRIDEDLKQLRKLLLMFDKATGVSKLESLLAAKQKWSARQYEDSRLRQVLLGCTDKVRGFSRPADGEISDLKGELADAQDLLNASVWCSSDESKMTEASVLAVSYERDIDRLGHAAADLKSANDRLSTIESAQDNQIGMTDRSWFGQDVDVITMADTDIAVADQENQQREYDASVGRKDAAYKAVKDADAKVSEMDLRIEEQKGRSILADDLGRLRDTFKPQGASLDYIDYKFGQIAQLASGYLAASRADFMVSPSTDIAMAYDFIRTDRPDEVWLPQNRMSGGQKVRLAVATLRAIHAMVMPNVGLLALDEPTTHLDEESKKSMADMLRTIGEEGTLQIIVCDHAPELVDAFGDEIKIQE